MSQTQNRKPIVWWHIWLSTLAFLIAAPALVMMLRSLRSSPSTYTMATAKVLEVRKVVDHTQDTKDGGKIIYRGEAHVQYVADGQMQDRWLRISNNMSQDSLLLKLASHPSDCLVYWSPNRPENAKCSLK